MQTQLFNFEDLSMAAVFLKGALLIQDRKSFSGNIATVHNSQMRYKNIRVDLHSQITEGLKDLTVLQMSSKPKQ